jgi:hypothetical protein
MIFNRYAATALILVLFAASADAASSASIDRQFSAAVARVLDGVRNDFLDGLSAKEKREFGSSPARSVS